MKLATMTLTAGLAACISLVSVVPAIASDSPLSLVKKSEAAESRVSYRGLKYADIVVGKRTIRAQFKIVHQDPDRTRTEYFSPGELNGIMTVERGRESWHYLPAQQKWQSSKWELTPRRVKLALKNYRVINGGRGMVAGRPAHIVRLVPKKKGNPSETIWIDAEHHLRLKNVLRNSAGHPISTSEFREIKFKPEDIHPSAFVVKIDNKPPEKPRVPALGFSVVKPKYVPKGYELVKVSTVPIENYYAAHLMYTNGINTISIFERKRGGKDSGKGPTDFGKWANVMRFDSGSITFTIISDIHKRELEKMADSIRD